jgi:hypothetical protein
MSANPVNTILLEVESRGANFFVFRERDFALIFERYEPDIHVAWGPQLSWYGKKSDENLDLPGSLGHGVRTDATFRASTCGASSPHKTKRDRHGSRYPCAS